MESMMSSIYGSSSSAIFNKDGNTMLPFSRDSVWNFAASNNSSKRTMQPIVTGTSVLGVVFDGGVMICADTLGSYGTLARFRECPRVMKVNDNTILGAGGDYADFQFLSSVIEQKVIDEECLNDGFNLKPKSLHCWLTRVLYTRRSKFDPLWNTFVVGGLQDKVPFLGHVDKIGTAFEAPTIATGYGAYLAQPLLREAQERNPLMSEAEARDLLLQCMKILYYRDTKAFYKYTLGIVTEAGARIEGPLEIETDWSIGLITEGYE